MSRTLGDITKELRDGIIGPAQQEAARIIADGRKQAEALVSQARQEAGQITAGSRQEAERTRQQMEADLETAARNFMIKLQEELEASVVGPVLDQELRQAVEKPGFLPRVLEEVLAAFAKSAGDEARLELLLPEKSRKELEAWFLEKCSRKMQGHVDVHFTDKINFGFKLGVQGSGAQFNFSDGLTEAFAQFCSPGFRRYFLKGAGR
jgi:vacuolar-type H+-ATPase subunit H